MTGRSTTGTPVGDARVTGVPSVPPGPLPAVALRGVSKVYGGGRTAVAAVDHIDLDVAPGELVCLVGASGCGKTTLLNLVADLDRPTTGRIDVQGRTA
ncbi:MAG TPA: ATP-binding cassette domain-containing protein, partial [Acidimicrobiales bacterium]